MSATYFKKFCVSALCAFISILAIGQDAEAKFAIEKTKGLSVIDGQKFSNLQNREINLGVLNVLQAIPFYPTLRNYMDLPAQGDRYASVRVFARALFRPFDPQNPVEIEPARQPNKLSYYLTPAILGEVVAESLLEDKETNLNIEDKKQLELRKKALAVRLFVNKPHFRERLAEPYERFCKNPGALVLIEIYREDLQSLADLLEILETSDRRFVIYCDDLSFDADDSSYKSLKAVLDGGLRGRPENVLFYATSNRRHLLSRDMIENEQAVAVHAGEVNEEKISLSDRFGLWIGFHKHDQVTYLDIVRAYAQHFNLEIDEDELKHRALEWSVTRGGRSGRVAWQFIQSAAAQYAQTMSSDDTDEEEEAGLRKLHAS